MNRKVGLFFGSFNPIHVGHLIIANHIVEHTDLREVWFVITPHNPFKKKSSLLDERQRLYMVNLAVEDNYNLRASSVEFDLPIPSYTVDTLAYLDEKYPDNEFRLIMGSDNLMSLSKWKNYEQIVKRNKIIVYPRPGYEAPELAAKLDVELLNVPQMILSASHIRKTIKDAKSIKYLVTEPVRKYIEEMNLYKS
ncbi:MAG: nicotinate-nucleotide adenylyltransferase [Saprospiraceae bacterium]|jgi:nicotinate-nucleotide adenylyltransferase